MPPPRRLLSFNAPQSAESLTLTEAEEAALLEDSPCPAWNEFDLLVQERRKRENEDRR